MRVHYIPGQCVGAFLWLPTSTLDHPLRSWIICPCPPGALADYAEWTMAHVVSVPGLLQFEGFFKSLMNGIESEHREREREQLDQQLYTLQYLVCQVSYRS